MARPSPSDAAPDRTRRLRWLGLLVWPAAALLLIWALRAIPLRETGAVLSRLGAAQLALLAAANLLAVLTFCGRWWVIVRALGYPVPYLPLVIYRLAAFGVTYFTPGSQFGGEPVQVYLLSKRHGVPVSAASASVAMERLLELVGNFTLLTAGVALTLEGPALRGRLSGAALALPLGLLTLPLAFLIATRAGRHPISGLLARLPARLQSSPRYAALRQEVAQAEADSTALMRDHPGALFHALLASGVSWLAIIGEMWLAARLLGAPLAPLQLAAVLTASRLAILAPLPGGLGTLEAGQVWMFGALGLDPAVGLSLALLARARDVTLAGIGLALLARRGWRPAR